MKDRYDLGQGLGIVLLGAGLGLSLALVEQALRRAWVQVLRGRQEGRSYLLAGETSALGLDERAEVGLFGDSTVARRHAEIVAKAASTSSTTWPPRAGPGSTARSSTAAARSGTATGSSSGRPSSCSADGDPWSVNPER